MAKQMVKCPYCEQMFDRNSEDFIKVGRRYAHKKCQEKYEESATEEEKEYKKLYYFTKELFGNQFNYVLVKQQVDKYIQQGYTSKGIRLSLDWFFNIQHNPIANSKGVGIVPYVYKEAMEYFLAIQEVRDKNKNISNYSVRTKQITIPLPQQKIKPIKLWTIED